METCGGSQGGKMKTITVNQWPPDWIAADEEPDGFSTKCPLNQARFCGHIYYWNNPCVRLNQEAGWSRGSLISKENDHEIV
jgi:hypothetical protein